MDDIKTINPLDSLKQYVEAVQDAFAFAGFLECPLPTFQICYLYNSGCDIDDAFSVGSDVYAGFEFLESLEAVQAD